MILLLSFSTAINILKEYLAWQQNTMYLKTIITFFGFFFIARQEPTRSISGRARSVRKLEFRDHARAAGPVLGSDCWNMNYWCVLCAKHGCEKVRIL
jgi:hypothetical protein